MDPFLAELVNFKYFIDNRESICKLLKLGDLNALNKSNVFKGKFIEVGNKVPTYVSFISEECEPLPAFRTYVFKKYDHFLGATVTIVNNIVTAEGNFDNLQYVGVDPQRYHDLFREYPEEYKVYLDTVEEAVKLCRNAKLLDERQLANEFRKDLCEIGSVRDVLAKRGIYPSDESSNALVKLTLDHLPVTMENIEDIVKCLVEYYQQLNPTPVVVNTPVVKVSMSNNEAELDAAFKKVLANTFEKHGGPHLNRKFFEPLINLIKADPLTVADYIIKAKYGRMLMSKECFAKVIKEILNYRTPNLTPENIYLGKFTEETFNELQGKFDIYTFIAWWMHCATTKDSNDDIFVNGSLYFKDVLLVE